MKILLSALMVCLYLGCSSTSEKEPQINTNPNLNYRDWIIITKNGSGYNKAELYEIIKEN